MAILTLMVSSGCPDMRPAAFEIVLATTDLTINFIYVFYQYFELSTSFWLSLYVAWALSSRVISFLYCVLFDIFESNL